MRRWLILVALVLAGCDESTEEGGAADAPVVVDGEPVPPNVIKRGEFAYMRWCASCHGARGRGDGNRAALAKRPPPDFTAREFRHVEVPRGELPSRDYFEKVIRRGIDGTIMKGMPVSERDMGPLVTYVRYLAARP